ncbi:hypothetical protein HDU97_009815 [Phlyctochytrium planicorne]|nr:hypothetical protein HDU97_009815 [Phlyctochytrium planicorne]
MKELKKKKSMRHDPLHTEILRQRNLETPDDLPGSTKRKGGRRGGADGKRRSQSDNADGDVSDDGAASAFVDSKTSKKILSIVKDQQMEISREESFTNSMQTSSRQANKFQGEMIPAVPIKKSADDSDDEMEEEEVEEYDEEEYDAGDLVETIELDENEASIMEKFMAKEPKRQLNLAELILSKIEEAESRESQAANPTESERKVSMYEYQSRLDPKVVEVYGKVGLLLSRYKSGKLPKTFKIIPSLPQWEEVLFLTNPDGWTPHATYQATRIFVSNLQAKLAQRFFAHVLLDRVRSDIAETKKLNYHLYLALKKGLYKPAAFFKGILFPLCESGNCTLREAAIVGSVLAKVSIPMEHSAVALLKIAEMDYTGANSLFLRILIDKKYALPYKVVDALVLHFIRFKSDPRPLPVLWHQSLLVFAQRYKGNITEEQKEALLELIKVKYHQQISPEIRRELESAQGRDEMSIDL